MKAKCIVQAGESKEAALPSTRLQEGGQLRACGSTAIASGQTMGTGAVPAPGASAAAGALQEHRWGRGTACVQV